MLKVQLHSLRVGIPAADGSRQDVRDMPDPGIEKILESWGCRYDPEGPAIEIPDGWTVEGNGAVDFVRDDRGRFRIAVHGTGGIAPAAYLLTHYGTRGAAPQGGWGTPHDPSFATTEVTDGYQGTIYVVQQSDIGDDAGATAAHQWLDENYPDWRDPRAYWDD